MWTTAGGTAVDVGAFCISATTLGGVGVAVARGTAGKKGLLLWKGLSPYWEDMTLDRRSLAGDEREKFLV